MSNSDRHQPSRALVLGGGGVTGIAWEVGILAGLLEAGVDLGRADAVIGTSAGAFVGVALASGYDMERLFAAQHEPSEELPAASSDELYSAWAGAFETGGDDSRAVGEVFGQIARAQPEPVPRAVRREVVHARLVTRQWPPSLQVTAIDADSGELRVFDQNSGVAVDDAVAASGAVPGIWPLEPIGAGAFTDGGMVSAANARLAAGHDRVIVIAPIPEGHGAIPGATEDVAAMGAHTRALLIAPDERSVEAIGPNPYDPARRGAAATAARAQGVRLSGAAAAVW